MNPSSIVVDIVSILSVPVKVSIPVSNFQRQILVQEHSRVADNAPGFLRTLPEFAEAVASRLIEPANNGSIENVSSKAPTFCNNSPAFDSVMKNGGTEQTAVPCLRSKESQTILVL